MNCEGELEEFFQSLYATAQDKKLQAFQFRLIHQIIPCNKFLKNIKIRQLDACDSCGSPDDTEHFLLLCPNIQHFLKSILDWLAQNVDFHYSSSFGNFSSEFQKSPQS